LNDVGKDKAANDLTADILSNILLLAETQVSALKATVKNGLSLTLDTRNIAALALMDMFIEGRTNTRVTKLLMEWKFTRQQILDLSLVKSFDLYMTSSSRVHCMREQTMTRLL